MDHIIMDGQSEDDPVDSREPGKDGDEIRKDETDSDSEDEVLDRYWPLPATKIVSLMSSTKPKALDAVAFDNAGSRFATGGHSHEVRIWDFQALDIGMPMPIAVAEPCGQAIIKNLDFAKNGEQILVIPESCQATIINKDGTMSKQSSTVKGDQYISDMGKTKGHVQMLNDGCWSPKTREEFITCSNDGTVRIWDVTKLSNQKTVIKTRSPISGTKATPTVCKYSRDASIIVAGCTDGSIMMWDTRRKFISTSVCIKRAHLKGSEIGGIDFAYGCPTRICSRSEDETCKIWDTRQPKEPVANCAGLATTYPWTDCSFSPDDRFILTGTSKTEKKDVGSLLVLNALVANLEVKDKLSVQEGSVIRSRWHPRINHIAFTCSDGLLRVGYDRGKSLDGILVKNSALY